MVKYYDLGLYTDGIGWQHLYFKLEDEQLSLIKHIPKSIVDTTKVKLNPIGKKELERIIELVEKTNLQNLKGNQSC